MRYVSKPTECEAMQWRVGMRYTTTIQQAEQIVAWVNANGGEARYDPAVPESGIAARIAVRTINGWAYAALGHYVVRGAALFNTEPVGASPDPARPGWAVLDAEPRMIRDFYLSLHPVVALSVVATDTEETPDV